MNELKHSRNGPEPDCIKWLEKHGFSLDELRLSSFERWQLHRKEIEELRRTDIEKSYELTLREFRARDKFIRRFGFAILNQLGIEAMRPYAPLLELGAGSGYWTYELQKTGIDCIATDTKDERFGFWKDDPEPKRWKHAYVEIEELNSVEAIRKYPNRNLLIVWPSLYDPWAADALDIFTGQVVIYMGEGYGNACADDRFHELLDERFANQEWIPMPHFEHSYDSQLRICRQPKQLTGRKNQT